MLTITKDHIELAKRLGACSVKYKVGTPISEVAAADLGWIESRAPEQAAELSKQLCVDAGVVMRAPLALKFFGNGDGYGYGYGDGNGYGYGDGDGYGDGNGNGDGYGDGNGYGYGDGNGYGYGDGDGYGNGYGDGYGASRA